MITYQDYLELRGLSTDTKPTENIPNGSTFFEIDTCTIYMFDEEHATWTKLK